MSLFKKLFSAVSQLLSKIGNILLAPLKALFNKIDNFSLIQFVLIGLAMFGLCSHFFPDRLPSLIALMVRMYVATIFVYLLYGVDEDLDYKTKPWLICAGFLAAGFSL